jgi:hypothetical protein
MDEQSEGGMGAARGLAGRKDIPHVVLSEEKQPIDLQRRIQ